MEDLTLIKDEQEKQEKEKQEKEILEDKKIVDIPSGSGQPIIKDKEGKNTALAPADNKLKEKAEKVLSVVIPKKKEAVDTNEFQLQEIKRYHRNLEDQERAIYGKNTGEIVRKRYDAISESDLEKRRKESVKRKDNARKVEEAEKKLNKYSSYENYSSEKSLEKKLKIFMSSKFELRSFQKDKDFAKNFQYNYDLCMQADILERLVSNAVMGGYMPKKYSLEKIQSKIIWFNQAREYFDVQKELMRNPYYQYMAKEDISYNDDQLERMERNTSDKTLKDYLTNVRKLRKMYFKRSKNENILKESYKKAGKRRANLLTSYTEKNQIINTLEENAQDFSADKMYLEQDADKDFTMEKYTAALERFNQIDVKDLHFKDIKDLADHYKENDRLFRETREFEHLLFIAQTRDLVAIDDNEMIKLRAKIRLFKNTENMVLEITSRMIENRREVLRNKSYDDIINESVNDISTKNIDEGYGWPRPGEDLGRYFNQIKKAMEKDYAKRENNIRVAYGVTHVQKKYVQEKNEIQWEAPEIPIERLRELSNQYEKNQFIGEYMAGIDTYLRFTYARRADAFLKLYMKKKGISKFKQYGRVLGNYINGMSSDQLKEVLDIQTEGTEEQKNELWSRILAECNAANLMELDSLKSEMLTRNTAYKSRLAGMFGNIGGNSAQGPEYLTDKKKKMDCEVVFGAGMSHGLVPKYVTEILQWNKLRSLPLDHLEGIHFKSVGEFGDELNLRNNTDQVTLGNMVITNSYKETALCDLALRKLRTQNVCKSTMYNTEKLEKQKKERKIYINTPEITRYEEMKHLKLIKDTSAEQLGKVKKFYDDYDKEKRSAIDILNQHIQTARNAGELRHDSLGAEHFYAMAVLKKEKLNKKEKPLKSLERYKATTVDRSLALSPQELQARANAIEEIAEVLMSFDLEKFNYKSYTDLISDRERFRQCESISFLATEWKKISRTYPIGKDQVRCRLSEEHIKEISARCNLIECTQRVFDIGKFRNVINSNTLKNSGKSIDEIMHFTKDELYDEKFEALRTGNAESVQFWENVLTLIQIGKEDGGSYGINVDLKTQKDTVRFQLGLVGESRETEILNILHDKQMVFHREDMKNLQLQFANAEVFGNQFEKNFKTRKLSVTDREHELADLNSTLGKKYELSRRVKDGRSITRNRMIKARRNISFEKRKAVGDENLNLLSAFMTSNKEKDEDMVSRYADQEQRFQLLDELTKEIIKYDININITTDAMFAENTPQLEKISCMAQSYEALLKANPEYADRLKICDIGDSQTNYEMLQNKLNHMLVLSDYYRARRLLMTDTYYIRHYNDELSASSDTETTEEQRRTADLIRLVKDCTERLSRRVPMRSNEAMERTLRQFEISSEQQAYVTGHSDLKKAEMSSVIKSKDEIQRYLDKLSELRQSGEIQLPAGGIEATKEGDLPQLRAYETDAVKGYLRLIRNKDIIFPDDDFHSTEQKKKIRSEVFKVFSGLHRFELRDPKTGEVLLLQTSPDRIIPDIVNNYMVGMPEEEILEWAEGFVVEKLYNLDPNKEEDFAYIKKRWLGSAKKLFSLGLNSIKRVESTYGTLMEQIPELNFVYSLGENMHLLRDRCQYAQNVAEMCQEQRCMIGGKTISLGEYLRKEGLVSENEQMEGLFLNSNVYQFSGFIVRSAANTISTIAFNQPEDTATGANVSNRSIIKYFERKYPLKGPHLTYNEERKYWKDAINENAPYLSISDESKYVKKKQFNLFSSGERNALKNERKREGNAIERYSDAAEKRKDRLKNRIKEQIGLTEWGKNRDEVIDMMIWFHPSMTTELDTGAAEDTEFISMVKTYLGIDVEEKEREGKRGEILRKMLDRLKTLNRGLAHPDNIDGQLLGNSRLIEANVLNEPNRVLYTSAFFRRQVYIGACTSMQTLMMGEKDKGQKIINEDMLTSFHLHQFNAVKDQVLQKLKRSRRYLQLKDLDNRMNAPADVNYAELELVLSIFSIDKEQAINKFNGKFIQEALRKFDINMYNTDEMLGRQEIISNTAQTSAEKSLKNEERRFVQQPMAYNEIVRIPQERGVHTPFENQGYGTNYCWACTMSGLMNNYAGRKISDLNMIKNHNFYPLEIEKTYMKDNQDNYDNATQNIEQTLAGNLPGNIMEFGDYVLDKLPNTAIHSAQIVRRKDKINDCKRSFREVLSKRLKKGPVGLLRNGHYIMVEEIRGGEILMVRNSLKDQADELSPYFLTVSDMFEGDDIPLELVWLENISGKEEEYAAQYDLKYNRNTKKFSHKGKTPLQGQSGMLQRKGIEASNIDNDYADGLVLESVYVPMHMNRNMNPRPGVQPLSGKRAHEKYYGKQKSSDNKKKSSDNKKKSSDNRKKETVEGDVEEYIKTIFKPYLDYKNKCYAEYEKKTGTKIDKDSTTSFNVGRKDEAVEYVGVTYKMTTDEWMEMNASLAGNSLQDKNVEQKNRWTKAMERIFKALLEFDISKLSYKSYDEFFSGGRSSQLVLFHAMFAMQLKPIEEYEKLIDDPNVTCSLTKEQLKEVSAKQRLLDNMYAVVSIIDTKKAAKEYNISDNEAEELMKMDANQLGGILSNSKTSIEKQLFCARIITMIGQMADGFVKPGENPEEVYKKIRVEKFHAGEKDLTQSALDAINHRLKNA